MEKRSVLTIGCADGKINPASTCNTVVYVTKSSRLWQTGPTQVPKMARKAAKLYIYLQRRLSPSRWACAWLLRLRACKLFCAEDQSTQTTIFGNSSHFQRFLCFHSQFKNVLIPSGSSLQQRGRAGSTLCRSGSSAARLPSSSGLWSPRSASRSRWTCRWWSEASRPPSPSQPSSVSPPHSPASSTSALRLLLVLPPKGSLAAGLWLEDPRTF